MRTYPRKPPQTILVITLTLGLFLMVAACSTQAVESASRQQSSAASDLIKSIDSSSDDESSSVATPEASGRLVDVVLCTSCGCIRIGHSLDDLEPGHEGHGFCWSQYWVYD